MRSSAILLMPKYHIQIFITSSELVYSKAKFSSICFQLSKVFFLYSFMTYLVSYIMLQSNGLEYFLLIIYKTFFDILMSVHSRKGKHPL